MPQVIDLFAGCGGFTSGLRSVGFEPLLDLELDTWAADTLRANFPSSHVIEGDIRDIDEASVAALKGTPVLVGGPPCQGFSVAGPTQFGVQDPRNDLVFQFLRWVEMIQPRIAVIENVPNILTKAGNDAGSVYAAIVARFEELGYRVQATILNAADYGVPQLRRRAFIVATQADIAFAFPRPTHHAPGREADLFGTTTAYTTVWDALSDLPQIEAGDGTDDYVEYATAPQNAYQEKMREGSNGVANHVAMKHTSRLLARFATIAPGKSLKDVAAEHGQIAKLSGERVAKPFKYNNYRLAPDKPSLAIPASFQSLFLHPYLNRNLTAREAARLMGFPDRFLFQGKRTTMSWEKNLSQYNQIGNAVCPPVASALGEAIAKALGAAPTLSIKRGSAAQVTTKTTVRLPELNVPIQPVLLERLTRLGQQLLGRHESQFFKSQSFEVPIAALPAAIAFATAKTCPVCSTQLAPFACHDGEMPFLISKEGLSSLIENEQDHGLDYHLRATLGTDHQVGHLVGEMLSELGLVELTMMPNARTGRMVRGMRVKPSGALPDWVFHELSQGLTHSTLKLAS